LKLTSFKLNEIGGRPNLEDAVCPSDFSNGSLPVFVVCDGVGGSSFGEVASDIASKTFYEVFSKGYDNISEQFEKMLIVALGKFKAKIADFVEEKPTAENTSTTLTLLVLKDGKAYTAWCGDSKIYHIRDGNVLYRSKDHSLVNELITQGIITEDQALTHPQRNVITRSLSMNTKNSDIDFKVLNDVRKGDWLLLCTDGLLEQFTELSFPALLTKYESNKDYQKIIRNICQGKTKDNFSMYLLNVHGSGAKSRAILVSAMVLLALTASGYWAYNKYGGKTVTPVEQPSQTPSLMINQVKALPKKDSATKDSVNNISVEEKKPVSPKKDTAKAVMPKKPTAKKDTTKAQPKK
jgi:serine/threonine protein phosphatase PrpC